MCAKSFFSCQWHDHNFAGGESETAALPHYDETEWYTQQSDRDTRTRIHTHMRSPAIGHSNETDEYHIRHILYSEHIASKFFASDKESEKM